MKQFSYREDLCNREIITIAIVSMLFAIHSAIAKYRPTFYFAIIGLLFGLAFYFVVCRYKKFVFYISEEGLTIQNENRIVRFSWNEISIIDEKTDGLVFKLKRDNIEFSILNRMENYEEFKALVKEKALQYSITYIE